MGDLSILYKELHSVHCFFPVGGIKSIVSIVSTSSILIASKKAFVKGIFLFWNKNKLVPPETYSILSRSLSSYSFFLGYSNQQRPWSNASNRAQLEIFDKIKHTMPFDLSQDPHSPGSVLDNQQFSVRLHVRRFRFLYNIYWYISLNNRISFLYYTFGSDLLNEGPVQLTPDPHRLV